MNVQTGPQKETIEGVQFEVTPLPWPVALPLSVRLAKALGPGLAVLLEGLPGLSALRTGPGSEGLAAVVARVAQDVTADDLAAAFGAMEESVRYSLDGSKWPFLTKANQEILFRGRILFSLRVLAFFCKVQFSDFFAFLAPAPGGAGPSIATPGS